MDTHPDAPRRSLASSLAGFALLACLLAAKPAMAESRLRDGGNFFSKDVAAKVATDLDGLANARNVSVIVETFDVAPAAIADQVKSTEGAAQTAAYVAYGKSRAAELGADFYIFATRQPGKIRTQTSPKAHQNGLSDRERDGVTETLVKAFQKREFDRGLLDAVVLLKGGLSGTTAAVPVQPNASPAASPRTAETPVPANPPAPTRPSSGFPITALIVVGALILIGFMIIRGLIRAATNRVANSGGYGPPPTPDQQGQPGYGQSGYGQPQGSGGFGRGIMGGLLGGAAGGYLANRAFGQGGQQNNANDAANSTDASAGGGTFGGNDSSGVEFGDSGGGDFGGGDAGGGGDSGGGDF